MSRTNAGMLIVGILLLLSGVAVVYLMLVSIEFASGVGLATTWWLPPLLIILGILMIIGSLASPSTSKKSQRGASTTPSTITFSIKVAVCGGKVLSNQQPTKTMAMSIQKRVPLREHIQDSGNSRKQEQNRI
jgi:hypothetical protein